MSRDSLPPFGRWVKQLRAANDLTQEQLSARVGCSVETIRKIESGDRRPSRQIAELLAQVLKLEHRAGVAAPVRAKALCGIGVMTEAQGVLERSVALLEESLALRRAIGDQAGIAESLLYLGRRARNQGDYQRAIQLEEESLSLFRSQRSPGASPGRCSA